MEGVNIFCKQARPILSVDACEARRRVLSLYKALYRFIPYSVRYFDIPKNECEVRQKIREKFYKNACVSDIRMIDVLVIKGWMEYKELRHNWSQKGRVMAYWNPTYEPKPCDFLGKFLSNID